MKLFGIQIGKAPQQQVKDEEVQIPPHKKQANKIAGNIIGSGESSKNITYVKLPEASHSTLRQTTTCKEKRQETAKSVSYMPGFVRSFINWCRGESSAKSEPVTEGKRSWHFMNWFRMKKVAPAEKVAPLPEVSVSMIKSEQRLPCLHAMTEYMAGKKASGASRLDDEGIFRLSSSKGDKQALISELLSSGTLKKNYDNAEVNPIPPVIKEIFKNYKIFTPSQQNELLGLIELPVAEKAAKIDKVMFDLSKDDRLLLIELFDFLKKVETHKESNKMTFSNLGVVFGPNLLPNVGIDSANQAVAEMIQYSNIDLSY